MNLRPRRREEPEITLTPLIDVVFLMLIFFMVSATFLNEADMELSLPEASLEPGEQAYSPIELAINASGDYYVDGEALVNQQTDTVQRALEQAREGRPDAPVIIRADGRTSHQSLVTALDAAGRASIENISIATVPEDD
ncbi:ExbD/TolR family protein [Aquisalimonas asiatica]|uniref:Biopolymer transport protein ExbD n=1 Tax=Aquisalimonas asiatica TaxID=406100 RepID=A0A1H8QEZ1_9GAMM|nr:biopolymer transporter ExbD [Aquisalimonas asiatica]SEO52772.1 biopolymer transport protein ExbD [Aquisalimonas asiatica]